MGVIGVVRHDCVIASAPDKLWAANGRTRGQPDRLPHLGPIFRIRPIRIADANGNPTPRPSEAQPKITHSNG